MAVFSEAVDPATITAATFTLASDRGQLAGTVAASGSTATLSPNAPLSPGTRYTATLVAAVRDLSGNPLSQTYSWNFVTATTTRTVPVTTAPRLLMTIESRQPELRRRHQRRTRPDWDSVNARNTPIV